MSDKFIYFIKPVGMVGPIKIGASQDPEGRRKHLMLFSPLPLEIAVAIPGSIKQEMNIHRCLALHHSHWEWFKPDPPVLDLIEKLKAGVPLHEAIDLKDVKGQIKKVGRNGGRKKVVAA